MIEQRFEQLVDTALYKGLLLLLLSSLLLCKALEKRFWWIFFKILKKF